MNIIWFLLITISVLFALATGNAEAFTTAMFASAKTAVEVCISLLGIVALWLGLTRIIETSGLIHHLNRFVQPVMRRLFRDLPPDHPAASSITLNFLANFFGLGNVATPMGIKAMQELQSLNDDKETISNSQMLFIIINTASIQLIPFTVIGILAQFGSKTPSIIVLPTIVATVISAVTAIGVLLLFRWIFNKRGAAK